MVPPPTDRSRTNDPHATRARILDAAVQLFHQKGYGGTSMYEIMQAAAVTGGALHHHYRTKKDLGIAVVRDRVAPQVSAAWILPVVNAATIEQGVARAINDVIGGMCEGAIVGCPLNNLALELAHAEPDFAREIQSVFDAWHDALASRLAGTAFGPTMTGMCPDEIATMIIACYSGAMTMAKSSQSVAPLRVAAKFLDALSREGVKSQPPQPEASDHHDVAAVIEVARDDV